MSRIIDQRLITDLATVEEEFRRQENLIHEEIVQIIEKLKNGLKKKCLDSTKMKNVQLMI